MTASYGSAPFTANSAELVLLYNLFGNLTIRQLKRALPDFITKGERNKHALRCIAATHAFCLNLRSLEWDTSVDRSLFDLIAQTLKPIQDEEERFAAQNRAAHLERLQAQAAALQAA